MSKIATKSDVKLVETVVEMQKDMNALTVDKINDQAPKIEEEELQTKITRKQIAAQEGVRWIEPIRKLQSFGKLPEKQQNAHKHDWEYVKGIFENKVIIGEAIRFWFSKYPGDPDCLWEVPANVPVYVPRMIATHLEKCMEYHEFSYIEKPSYEQTVDAFQQNFRVTKTQSRGRFAPIGAFQ